MCDRWQIIKNVIVCPNCHSDVNWLQTHIDCVKCKSRFIFQGGVLKFVDCDIETTKDSRFQSEQMFDNTLTAKLFNFGKKIISSEYMPRNHVKEFIGSIRAGKVIVELGSGNRRLRGDVINVDLFPFPNVDLTMDIAKTSFGDESVDFIILDTVLEHVPDPHLLINEIFRILKPSGKVICITPFISPYHGYPKNYANFSKDGLEFLFKDFSECRVEMNIGPMSALVNFVAEYFAVALGGENKFLYTLFKGVGLLPIFFLKYLDKLWDASGRVTRISSLLCALATK